MKTETKIVRANGISTMGILGVVFVVLKILGHIEWSWWWVTAPFWGPPVIALAIIGIIPLFAFIAACFK